MAENLGFCTGVTDGRTDGRTNPLIEMRGRIQKKDVLTLVVVNCTRFAPGPLGLNMFKTIIKSFPSRPKS